MCNTHEGGRGGTQAESTYPASLNPKRGAFQLLGVSALTTKAAHAFNGMITVATKTKKIKEGKVRGVLVYPAQDLSSILLFPQTGVNADLTGEGTPAEVMVGAGSSNPDSQQVLAVGLNKALRCMIIAAPTSLYSEFEDEMEDTTGLEKLHRGDEFVVTADHCLKTWLTVGESVRLYLLPVGPALRSGTTPPRGPIDDDFYSTVDQGGQGELGFITKAITARTPAQAYALQQAARANSKVLGDCLPHVPQGASLAQTYLTTVVSADSPRVERILEASVAACLGEKKAAVVQ